MGNISVEILLGVIGVALTGAIAVYEARRSRRLERQIQELQKAIVRRGPRESDTTATEHAERPNGLHDFRHYGVEILRLPERERLTMILHYYEGLSFKEIADVLSVRTETVRQIHNRAVHRIRDRLYGPEDE